MKSKEFCRVMSQKMCNLKQLIVILGPTAVGKTALTIQLARDIGTEIISADARQCYRYMDIGTAKPTVDERAQVVHHLVDFLSLESHYSAGAFEQDGLRLLEKLWARYDRLILTGGSGLYIKALCEGLASVPSISKKLYAEWDSLYKEKGLEPLLQKLAEQDPAYYAQVDRNNPHRVIRALAVCQATGRPYTYFRSQKPTERLFKILKIGLTLPREVLYQRINKRVDAMVDQGLFEEVKSLYAYRGLPCLQTIGYQEVFGFLEGKFSKAATIDLIKQRTRNYAKRQLTWLRKDKGINWFAPTDVKGIKLFIEDNILKQPS